MEGACDIEDSVTEKKTIFPCVFSYNSVTLKDLEPGKIYLWCQ
jgi:hypothetical protein